MEIIRDVNKIAELITSIGATQAQQDKNIQLALCSMAVHLHAHKNITLVNKLIGELNTSGIRGNAIKLFIEMFMPARWDQKKKVMAFSKKNLVDNFEQSDLFKRMVATMWTGLRPDPEYKGFDMAAKTESLIKLAEKQLAEADALTDEERTKLKVDAEEIRLMREFAQRLAEHRAAAAAAAAQAAIAEQGE